MSERQKKKLAQKEANRLKKRMIEKVKSSNSAFNLNFLVDGWLELESDPGTFSLLIEDFGCYGAQVDEIYDLEQKFEGPVFGFIFLFKWLNNHQSDRSRNQKSTSTNNDSNNDKEQPPNQREWSYVEDENIISEMFFAKQMISNSCATHALISILLNCDYHELNLGPTLTRLKEHTKVMNPENKGYAIGNLPELAKAHNSHASYSSLYNRNRAASHSATGMSYMISGNQRTNLQQQNLHEAYHFVSYVPINNRLYELDGLKNYPIDHGPVGPKEDWTEKFRSVIKQRLLANKAGGESSISNEIRYSLMAVVPDKKVYLRSRLTRFKQHRKLVEESIGRLTKRVFTPLSIDVDIPNPPYSPLSNGTLTASESGSCPSSPTRFDENFSEDNNKIDRFFFVKFDKQADPTSMKEDNSEPAHKNCVIELETTNIQPLNLTSDASTKVVMDVDPKQDDDDDVKEGVPIVQHTQANGIVGDNAGENEKKGERVNETPAHNNEKYNLSKQPPFDFNILDDMQHIHVGKSTLKDLKDLSQNLAREIGKLESSLKEEIDKRRKYKVDNSRRTHNYEPFIMTFLSLLAKQGNLADLIEKDLGLFADESAAVHTPSQQAPPASTPQKLTAKSTAGNKVSISNGAVNNKTNSNATSKPKPKYKYVSTGRPVGRPRKNPLPPTTPVKCTTTK